MEQNELVFGEEITLRKHMAKTFGWMTAGLLATGLTAYLTYATGFFITLFSVPYIVLFLAAAELGLVIFLSARLAKMSYSTAIISFLLYSVMTGLTFSVLLLAYGFANVLLAFAFTSVMFISMSVIGFTTKTDLSKFRNLLLGGLIAVVVMSVIGMFMDLGVMDMAICYIGLGLFLCLTAYDTQKIIHFYYASEGQPELRNKMAIYSALELYLDFVNIFLYILRILGKRSK